MNGLARRLTTLEEIADERRRREVQALILSWPEFGHLTAGQLDEATDEALRCHAEIAAWRRGGLTERQIIERWSDEHGIDMEVLDTEYRAVLETQCRP